MCGDIYTHFHNIAIGYHFLFLFSLWNQREKPQIKHRIKGVNTGGEKIEPCEVLTMVKILWVNHCTITCDIMQAVQICSNKDISTQIIDAVCQNRKLQNYLRQIIDAD